MRLLIVEDEKQICDAVAKSLYDAGYEVDTCYDGEEALEYILTENYDLIVLDLNLPGMDGMEILKELRQSNEETKVLILSARGQIADKVEGLDAGANDYMEKPFHLQELEARIRSLTRRKFVQKDVCLESGDIMFDTIKREAYAKETKISWMLSSVSVPRPRRRCSSSSTDGGSRNTVVAPGNIRRMLAAPCTSMTRTTSLPASRRLSTSSRRVP